jgi:VIT1/CCC1 family predicted Fe2+/Mn2+ transporter|tara:strand:- start:82 stop:405 length:324 start_codon:yes stop_codon:yes gene_type:complete
MGKKLQADSKYAMADADGDGVVTDEEMDRHAMWIRLENEDRQADTQRLMALISMSVSIAGVVLLLLPIITLERMEVISPILSTFLIANTGIVAAYITGSALSKTKMK